MRNSSSYHTTEIEKRIAVLEQMTPLVSLQVPIPCTNIAFDISAPTDIDLLLDSVTNDPEENLPYWAEVWPSGVALASEILLVPDLVSNKQVIELGCGVGITAAAAMLSGASLTAVDYSPWSLILTELTCLLADAPLPATRQLNWRDHQAQLLQESGNTWPVILAADVLYENRDIDPLLRVFHHILAADGFVLLAEPGRIPAKAAIEKASSGGWNIETSQHCGPWPICKDVNAVVSVHKMTRR